MNRDQLLQPSSYWTDYAKHYLYRDVVEDSWSHMDPHADWSLPHHRWTETNQDEGYYRSTTQFRDHVPEYSPQQYNAHPMEQYHPQVRQLRPQMHSQHSVPSFMEYQGRVPPVQLGGTRCISQPGYHNRVREEQMTRVGRAEGSSPVQRRCSDSGFPSDMDLALFVAATSGFTPDSPVHRSFGDAPTWREQPHQRPEYTRSHTSYTSSTLAQRPLPLQSSFNLPVRQPQPRSPQFSHQGPDAWQQRLEMEPHAWQSHAYGDEQPPADELPDYEQSQAEMQNRNRIEAKRRAEELQRRWKQRHSR